MAEAGKTFGTCCEELKEALEGGDFEPCLTVGPNEIIYMTIGLVAQEGDETALVDHPLFFLPFLRDEAADGGRSRSQGGR
jgi:hypothetical protein